MSINGDLFDRLLDAGNDMIDALADRDLDGYGRALDVRTSLIDKLRSAGAPPAIRDNWKSAAKAIAEQDRHILDLAQRVQEEIASQLAQTTKMGHASRSYGSNERSGSMLRGSLHG